MDNTEKITVSENKPNYIKPYVLYNFGTEIATILANAYAADSANAKLEAVNNIQNCNLKVEAKIKFIGDIMVRPRKERMAISRKLFKLLEEGNDSDTKSITE